jgi:hypothetical protein
MKTATRILALTALWTLVGWVSVAQTAAKPSEAPPPPTLSTADKVAIQTFEKAKGDAQKQYQDAQQGELAVEREWGAAHPGWHLDAQTFAVEADAPPAKPVEPKK